MAKKRQKNLENKKIDYSIKKYVFWILLLALFVISVLIIRPFIIALISAFILAYLVKPVYSILSKKINKSLSAAISVILILLMIIIPASLTIVALINQIGISEKIDFGWLTKKVSSVPLLEKYDINELKANALSLFLSLITSTLKYMPSLIISMLITLLGVYYTLVNWDKLSYYLGAMLPFENKKRIRSEISEMTKGIIFGYLLIALIEFLVASIGFYIAGVKPFLLLASLIALFAFIPAIGPGLVWVPTVFYYAITQNYTTAIGVLITGIVISIMIENFLFMKLVGKKSKIQPLVFLLGVLGGVPLFGIFGFLIGPLVLVYSIKLIRESLKAQR